MVGPWLCFDSKPSELAFLLRLHFMSLLKLPFYLSLLAPLGLESPSFRSLISLVLVSNFSSSLTSRYCVLMESSHEGAIGKDSLSPWWGPGCGSRFYRHVSQLFGHEVLGVTAGQKAQIP